jgi:hypothetical protein
VNEELHIPPTPLERHARLLLRAYPRGYREDRGEEMIGTMLEAAPEDQHWPPAREAWSLIRGGIRARAAVNHQVPIAAALRQAAILGISLDCARLAGNDVQPLTQPSFYVTAHLIVQPTVSALMLIAVAALAWTGSRLAVLAGAIAAAVASIWLEHSTRASMAHMTHAHIFVPGLSILVPNVVPLLVLLAVLVAVTGRTARPPVAWLAFPCLVAPLTACAIWFQSRGGYWGQPLPMTLLTSIEHGRGAGFFLLAGFLATAWLVTDARPAAGVAAFVAVIDLPPLVQQIQQAGDVPSVYAFENALNDLQTVGVGVALMAALAWLHHRRTRKQPPTAS